MSKNLNKVKQFKKIIGSKKQSNEKMEEIIIFQKWNESKQRKRTKKEDTQAQIDALKMVRSSKKQLKLI